MKKYFSLLPLRFKLLLIGVIPIIFLFYLGTQYYSEKQQRLSNLRGTIDLIKLNGQIATLISHLQNERKLGFDKRMGSGNEAAWRQQTAQTDSAITVLNHSQDLSINGFTEFTNLQDLQHVRMQTDTFPSHADVANDFYASAIFRLNTLTVVNGTRNGRLQPVYDDLKSHLLLAQLTSYQYIIRGNVYNALFTHRYMTEMLIGTYGIYKLYNSYEKEFYLNGAAGSIKQYKRLLSQTDLKDTKAFIDRTFATFKLDSTYTADEWWRVSASGLDSLKNMEQQLWSGILKQTDTIYESYETDKEIALLIMIVLLVATVGIVLYISVVISQMLNDLKHKAQQIANGQSDVSFAAFSNDEIGGLAAAIQRIDENQKLLSHAADQIGKGNFKTTVRPRSKEDILGNAIVEMQAGLQTFSEKMEALVKERTSQLESSNADLQQFAHVASHDLKEPLRKIQYFNSRLNDDYGNLLPDKAKTYLQKIDNAAVRLSKLVDGILKYSVVNASENDFENIRLNDVILSIVTDLELMITQKQAVVSCDCPAIIHGVPLLIQQLFYNLLYNALKFSKPDVAPVIHISCSKIRRSNTTILHHEPLADNLYEIAVTDNGIGFSKENEKRIFEVFGRLHSHAQYEGTGLGLALCKKIVTLHHGFIMAQGKEGEGAVFKIYLPVQ